MSKFYIIENNESAGSFTVEELAAQNITPDTIICAEGQDSPVRAGDVEELKNLFAGQTNSPSPLPAEHSFTENDDFNETIASLPNERYKKLSILKFWPAVRSCLGKLFDFKSRARRSEFWWFILAGLIVDMVLSLILDGVINDVILKYILCILILSATSRRLHDTGRSFSWILLGLIPAVGTLIPIQSLTAQYLWWIKPTAIIANLFFIAMLCDDSEKSENEYGPSPKYVDTTDPEQLFELQYDDETRTSSILFPIITFLIIFFVKIFISSPFFSLLVSGAMSGDSSSTYDTPSLPYDTEYYEFEEYGDYETSMNYDYDYDDIDSYEFSTPEEEEIPNPDIYAPKEEPKPKLDNLK